MVKPNPEIDRLVRKFQALSRAREEGRARTDLLISLIRLFGSLADKKAFLHLYPEFTSRFSRFCEDLDHGDPECIEDDLTLIYAYLHGQDSAYAPEDRKAFDACGGYWCHAGGLSPLYRAGPYITEQTRLADYGAGNGLQGLLFQYLYPHRKTVQIELSGPMIHRGKQLQTLMGIASNKVEWVHKNVMDVPPSDFDFIYIYRPVRPEGKGRAFYQRFAEDLAAIRHRVILFSIADCLKDFLGSTFKIFYDDGHLTCFTNEDLHGTGPGT